MQNTTQALPKFDNVEGIRSALRNQQKKKIYYFLSCTKLKYETTQPAIEIYQKSMFFTKMLHLTNNLPKGEIFILSGKHGLLSPHEKIGYYDQSLNSLSKKDKQKWKNKVYTQLDEYGIDKENSILVFLTGINYIFDYENRYDCIQLFPKSMGIGHRLQYMTNLIQPPIS